MYSGSIWSDIVMNDEEQEEKKSDNIKYELRFFDECITLLLVSRKNTSGEARTEKKLNPSTNVEHVYRLCSFDKT